MLPLCSYGILGIQRPMLWWKKPSNGGKTSVLAEIAESKPHATLYCIELHCMNNWLHCIIPGGGGVLDPCSGDRGAAKGLKS